MPDRLKPNLSGVIVILDRQWHGRDVIRALPTGARIPDETLEWLKAFAREQSLPLMFNEYIVHNHKIVGTRKLGYGPPSFVRAVESAIEPEDTMMR